jgi:hypothetical protein
MQNICENLYNSLLYPEKFIDFEASDKKDKKIKERSFSVINEVKFSTGNLNQFNKRNI